MEANDENKAISFLYTRFEFSAGIGHFAGRLWGSDGLSPVNVNPGIVSPI
jgi:hypothetical protein